MKYRCTDCGKCEECGECGTCWNCTHKHLAELEAELEEVKETCKAVSQCHDIEREHNAELAEEIAELEAELAEVRTVLNDVENDLLRSDYLDALDKIIKAKAKETE